MIQTTNKTVACSPMEKTSIQIDNKHSFATAKQRTGLITLNVLFPNENKTFVPEDMVVVKGDSIAQPWAKEVYDYDGVKFILVPEMAIIMVKKK